jgi:hypothetical protein
MYLEPVINCPAGGVLPRHVRAGDPIAIFAATRRAGANFPHFGVARHSKIPDIRRSSLLELRKIGSQRRPRES